MRLQYAIGAAAFTVVAVVAAHPLISFGFAMVAVELWARFGEGVS